MKKILIPAFFATLAIPFACHAASFDCTKAASETEKLICSYVPLSRLDERLAKSYKKAMEKSTDKEVLKKTQVEWLKQQRACKDIDCLMRLYEDRVVELDSLKVATEPMSENKLSTTVANADGKKPLMFKLVYGDSYPICQPYVDMLNKTKYTEYPACERKILPEFSQFKDLVWTEITDKQKIIEIEEERLRIGDAQWNRPADNYKPILNQYIERIKSKEFHVFYTEFDIGGDGDVETIYKEIEPYRAVKSSADCDFSYYFYVHDKKININTAKDFIGHPYYILSMDHRSQLFSIEKHIYSSYWTTLTGKYDIELFGSDLQNKYTKIGQPVCGIKIQ